MIAQVGMAVNRVAAMPITLREIAMGDMAWVTGVALTARGAVTPHSDAHLPTTTSTSANNDIDTNRCAGTSIVTMQPNGAARYSSNAENTCEQPSASSSNSVGVAFPQPRVAGEARYPGYQPHQS